VVLYLSRMAATRLPLLVVESMLIVRPMALPAYEAGACGRVGGDCAELGRAWDTVVDLEANIGVGREKSWVSFVGGKYVPGSGLFGLTGEGLIGSRGLAVAAEFDSFLV
jgi:hypothetical protein